MSIIGAHFFFYFFHSLFRFGLSETIFIFGIFHDPTCKRRVEEENFRDNRISDCKQCFCRITKADFFSRCLSQLKKVSNTTKYQNYRFISRLLLKFRTIFLPWMRDDPSWIFSLLLRFDAVRLPISTDCAIVQITNRKKKKREKSDCGPLRSLQ